MQPSAVAYWIARVDAVLELGDAVGMRRDAALARAPVAGGQVVQDLRQAVLVEPPPDVVRLVLVGKEVFHAREAGAPRGGEAVEEGDLVEEHRQVGGEFRHSAQALRLDAFDEHEPVASLPGFSPA